jgi:acyl-CoA reductase-like NAD-dependent aldehyde dehydrogenase
MAVMRDEPFGPVAPIASFSSLEEALAVANDTPFGLAGYVFTRDLRTAHLAAEGLEAGVIGVNRLRVPQRAKLRLAASSSPATGAKTVSKKSMRTSSRSTSTFSFEITLDDLLIRPKVPLSMGTT